MEKTEMTFREKVGIGASVALAAIAAVAIGIALAAPGCSDSARLDGGVLEEASEAGKDAYLDAAGASKITKNAGADDASDSVETQANGGNDSDRGSVSDSLDDGAAGRDSSGSGDTGSSGSSQSSKRWVADYKQVWVEDSAAWDEQVPIYGQREISVCNICGADVSGCEASHAKAHMLAGGGSGHHSEVVTEIVGYDTVHHDASGHWETVEDGGHWE